MGVICWGDNTHGQSNVPTLSNPTQVSWVMLTAVRLMIRVWSVGV